MVRLRRAALPLLLLPALLGHEGAGSAEQAGSKIWVGRYREIEEYLRTAECVTKTTLGAGLSRCNLPPGGPVARMAWRTASARGLPRFQGELQSRDRGL